jgi:polar amino acid transport system substrate-binding protein
MKSARGILISLLLLLPALVLNASDMTSLQLVTDEWPPYTSKQFVHHGFITEIVLTIARGMHPDAEVLFAPWKRCEQMITDHSAFAAFPYIRTAEREKRFVFSEPLFTSRGVFFYDTTLLKKEIRWTRLEDLRHYRIGGVSGYWYEGIFSAAGLSIDYSSSDENNILKLMAHRIDLVPTDEMVGWYLLRKSGARVKQFRTLSRPLNHNKLCLMVSRSYPDGEKLLNAFNAELRRLRASGEYRRILKRNDIPVQ